MFTGGNKRRRVAGSALAACALAALLAAAGCGSGGSGSSQPSWGSALGSGVTIVAPGSASPGNDSPDAVMVGAYKSIAVGPVTDFCKYEQPSQQANCKSELDSVPKAEVAKEMPTFKNFALGYSAIHGTEALVGTTGTVCAPNEKPSCYTNTDPAAIMDSGKSFATLWKEALAANSNSTSNVYSLSPCIEIDGSWYADTSNS
jgi:hypothetical protein